MTTCFGYTRVSTVKQGEGVSLEAQRTEISRYADRHGLTITKWYEEKETAAKIGRPVFTEVVRSLKAGKARGLIVHKIDRSARNFRDWAIIGDLSDSGIQIHFATESLDFESRGGRLTADIQAVIAADYIRNLRDETKKGLYGRLEQGLYPYKAPLGYLDQGRGNAKIPDPDRAQLVREMFEIYGTGAYSLRTLADEMECRGLRSRSGRKVSRSSIENLLSNPFYTGIILIKRTGETYPGVHEPLIPVALFERVQDIKLDRYGKKTTRHEYTYRGLLRCGHCSSQLTGERQKGRVYYRCHTQGCPLRCFREDHVEDAFSAFLECQQISSECFLALSEALTRHFNRHADTKMELAAVDLKLAQVRGRIDTLTDAFLDQLLDRQTFQDRKTSLLLSARKLEQSRDQIALRSSDPRMLQKFFELVKNLVGLHEIAEQPERRLLMGLTTSNRLATEGNLTFEPSSWLDKAIDLASGRESCLSKATFRTSDEALEQRLRALLRPEQGKGVQELLAETKSIVDRYVSLEARNSNAE